MKYSIIPTSAEVWAVIKSRHGQELVVFSSYSDPDGRGGNGEGCGENGLMETSYGFKGADCPIMEARTTWRINPNHYKRLDEKHEYWLCIPQEDNE